MQRGYLVVLFLATTVLYEAVAVANSPVISLTFADPSGVCKDSMDKTQFAYTYNYHAHYPQDTTQPVEYYSHIISVNNSLQRTLPPSPIDLGYPDGYSYNDVQISSSGMCGDRDLDYYNLGNCYLTNLIPEADKDLPYSYHISITPKATTSKYGVPSYNLSCRVINAAESITPPLISKRATVAGGGDWRW